MIITKFHIKDDINDNVFSYLDYEMYFDSDFVHAIKFEYSLTKFSNQMIMIILKISHENKMKNKNFSSF